MTTYPLELVKCNRQKLPDTSEGAELELLYSLVGMSDVITSLENSLEVSLKVDHKTKHSHSDI